MPQRKGWRPSRPAASSACFRGEDLAPAGRLLCRRFMRLRWPPTLDRVAERINPLLESMMHARGWPGYYWVTEQREIATDLMFPSRPALHRLLPNLFEHSLLSMSAEDALRFLGRKPNGHYQGEATADLKRRPEGVRVKFRLKRNSIKMYDKWSVLRIETTIDNPREFEILRKVRGSLRWMRMAKGVANFWRLNQLGQSANARFLEALGSIQPTHQAVVELDRLSRGRIRRPQAHRPLQPRLARQCSTLRRRPPRTSSPLLTFRQVDFPQAFATAA